MAAMKIRLFFEPLTIIVPDDEVPLRDDPEGEADVDVEALQEYIEENWSSFVDSTEPVIGALKPAFESQRRVKP